MYFRDQKAGGRSGLRKVTRGLLGVASTGALLLAGLVAPVRAMAATATIDYCYGAGGMVFSNCSGTEIATDADIPVTLTDLWYVVTGVINHTGSLTIDGTYGQTVRIVLADGASLTITGDPGEAGIVVPPGQTLVITSGMGLPAGSLTVTGGDGAAGIGSAGGDAGAVFMYGGIVNATGGAGAPAIGSGAGGNPSTIAMDAGTLTAVAGANSQSLLGTFTTPGNYFCWTNTTTADPGGPGLLGAFSNSSDYQFVKITSAYQLTLQAYGGAITTGADGFYEAGTVIDIAAEAEPGYEFDGWYLGLSDGVLGDPSSLTTTFTMPRSNANVIAYFDDPNDTDTDDPDDPDGGSAGGTGVGGDGSNLPSGGNLVIGGNPANSNPANSTNVVNSPRIVAANTGGTVTNPAPLGAGVIGMMMLGVVLLVRRLWHAGA